MDVIYLYYFLGSFIVTFIVMPFGLKLIRNLKTHEVYQKKVNAKLFIKKYTIFSHYLKLIKILK